MCASLVRVCQYECEGRASLACPHELRARDPLSRHFMMHAHPRGIISLRAGRMAISLNGHPSGAGLLDVRVMRLAITIKYCCMAARYYV